jgi:ABC-2 type transport system ATP-binding protein
MKFAPAADDRETRGADHAAMELPETSPPAIVVEGLTKRYRHVTAVDDLSFTVRRGAVTGFLGPNGAGKTTALKAIVGIARPTAGRTLIDGALVESTAPDACKLGVYIDSCGAHPGRSARAHLRSLAALAALSRERVAELLSIVGLEQAASRRVGTFSMGMRQRLGLASALLADPDILVLDEPLNGLDPQGIRWVRGLLRERAASGKTVLLSSHVLSEAALTVDDVVVIHKGRLIRQGSIEELERLGRGAVVVSSPTVERLAAVVRHAGARVELQPGGHQLLFDGRDAARGGEPAHDERVVLHELSTRGGSLEDVFFDLTEEDVA